MQIESHHNNISQTSNNKYCMCACSIDYVIYKHANINHTLHSIRHRNIPHTHNDYPPYPT